MRRPQATEGVAWLALAAVLAAGAGVAALGGLAPGTAWSDALDWRPDLVATQPWRLWTCAWVHWSGAHLGVNIAGAAVIAAVGWRARMNGRAALAWAVAWPLTHLLMLAADPGRLARVLPHYVGLSGVLHAGVIVLGLTLAWPRKPAPKPPRPFRADTGFGGRTSTLEPSRITEGPWAMTSLEESPPTAQPGSTLEAASAPSAAPAGPSARDRWIGAAIVAGTLFKVMLESPWNLAPRPDAALGIAVAPLAHACGVLAGAIAWGLVVALPPRDRTPLPRRR